MTWRWGVEDIDERVNFARSISPSDFFTMFARLIVSRATFILAFILIPFDILGRFIGKGLVAVVLGFFVLMFLDIVWLIVWGLLVGTSWIWLRYPWARPFLVLPGMTLAVSAHIFVMIAPDPHKNDKYPRIAGEWPLTWLVWSPPDAYFRPNSSIESDNSYRKYTV